MVIIVICLLVEKKSTSLKLTVKMLASLLSFVMEASNDFGLIYSKDISLKGHVSDCSVDYSIIDKFEILSIRKYLIVTNNI